VCFYFPFILIKEITPPLLFDGWNFCKNIPAFSIIFAPRSPLSSKEMVATLQMIPLMRDGGMGALLI